MNTTIKAKHRIQSLALALCLALGMTLYLPGPVEVQAVEIGTANVLETGPDLTGTQVYFGSYNGGDSTGPIKWHVMEVDGNTAVLWTTTSMGNKAYDHGNNHNDWSGSLIKQWLNGEGSHTTDGFLPTAFTAAEAEAIRDYGTTEQANLDHVNTTMINISQKIVLPSVFEISNVPSGTWGIPYTASIDGKRGFGDFWWLRSPGKAPDDAAYVYSDGGVEFADMDSGNHISDYCGIRPAFRLDLSSVLFTSGADGAGGKPSGLIGGSLAAAQKPAPTSAIKLTVEDEDQTLDVTATTVQETQTDATLAFGYQNAITGPKQWVSCFLENQGSGDGYYGKLVDLSGSPDSGDLSIPLAGVADGTYTLHLFCEQDNGDYRTDFASKPVTMKVKVDNSVGTVSEFDGAVLSDNASLLSVAGEAVATSGGSGTKDSPYTASIALSYGVSGLGDIDLAAAPRATAALYGDNTYAARQSPVDLDVGDNNLYVKVTAEDLIREQYYHIAATRAVEPEEPYVAGNPLTLAEGETKTLAISLGRGDSAAESATITSNKPGFATVDPPSLNQSGGVRVTGVAKGEAVISIGYSGGTRNGQTDTVQVTVTDPDKPDPNPGSGTTSRDRSSSSGSTPDGQRAKTTLPASAFSWDGRTLTIDHDSVTVFGLQSVRWNDVALERDTDYSVYKGSVIIRFSEAFMAAQKDGEHTVRVEFLNHTGETTITVGETGSSGGAGGSGGVWDDNDTHNPSTGGYPDGSYPGTDNPNTGDGRSIWAALLLGSLGASVLAVWRRTKTA